jgi:hypothetical protein
MEARRHCHFRYLVPANANHDGAETDHTGR